MKKFMVFMGESSMNEPVIGGWKDFNGFFNNVTDAIDLCRKLCGKSVEKINNCPAREIDSDPNSCWNTMDSYNCFCVDWFQIICLETGHVAYYDKSKHDKIKKKKHDKIKRYVIFGGKHYEVNGGLKDIIGTYEKKTDANNEFNKLLIMQSCDMPKYDWLQLVDITKGKIIRKVEKNTACVAYKNFF